MERDFRRSLSAEEIAAMDARQVAAALDTVEEQLAAMRAKADLAAAERRATGEWADPQWWARLHAARRFKGVEHQRLLRRAAELKRTPARPEVTVVAEIQLREGLIVGTSFRVDDAIGLNGRFLLCEAWRDG